LDIQYADSSFRLAYRKKGFFRIDGEIHALHLAEWEWKVWLLLTLGFPEVPGVIRYVSDHAALVGQFRSQVLALRTHPKSVAWNLDDDAAQITHDLETRGYFYRRPPPEYARHGALRLNFDNPHIRFAISVATSEASALREAEEGLHTESPLRVWREDPEVPESADARAAVRDVIGWNTIFDAQNKRWFTALSRNWAQSKFGGWGVWLNDVLFHAYIASFVDIELAERNLSTALNGLTPDGNLPCLLNEYDEWVDRTQPPISATMTLGVFRRSGSRALLEASYSVLLSAYRWWAANRDGNGNGLLEYGTSAAGTGMYIGTSAGARCEASMENSPMYDGVILDEAARTLQLEDVGLNSLLANEAESLAEISRHLGCTKEAEVLEKEARWRAGMVRTEMWDPDRQIFANRHWDGRFSARHSPTSFYPLVAGAASQQQATALISAHLLNERRFWGRFVLPSIARDDPAFGDNVYWRGRVWGPLNFWTYLGLRRYAFRAEARELATRSLRLFWGEWHAAHRCYENFNSVTGKAGDQPDSDSFYTWGALLPLLTLLEEESEIPESS
jgi:mannosylglycerate hydrolase MGH1-like protein